MSKTFYVAIGGLLLLVSGCLFQFAEALHGLPPARRSQVAVGFAMAGLAALVHGLRNPYPAHQRGLVRRKLAPLNLVLGPLLILASLGLLYVVSNVWAFIPHSWLVGALLGVPGGVILTATVFEEICGRCGTPLTVVYRTGADVAYCTGCLTVAVRKEGNDREVLRDQAALQLIAEVDPARAKAPARRMAHRG
ncbi:MAG: hypothetical protein QM767_28780 [Anaeromyxobacter sp.]